MRRLIDANALLGRLADSSESWAKNLQAIRNWWPHAVGIKDNIVRVIEDMPTVDAVEVVHGRWVDRCGGKYANPLYECSECKKPAPTKCEYDVLGSLEWHYDLTPYCPNCGAKMDGGNEDV